jgi:hypothetical protein
MPLPIQSGELVYRLRSFFRLVGRVPAQLDEMTVPTVNISDLGGMPYRSDPVEFAGFGSNDGAVGASVFNWGFAVLPATAGGVAVLREMTVYVREAMNAATTVVSFLLAAGTDPAFTDQRGAVLLEPVSRPAGGALNVTPVRGQGTASTLAALAGNSMQEHIERIATATGQRTFPFPNGILLLPGTWVGGTVNGTDAGGATIECGVSFKGEYYQSLPDR